jgi:hypothetical protein
VWDQKRYHSLDYELKKIYGRKIYKLSLNAGLTCPNRDGTLGSHGCIFCGGGGSGDFAASPDKSITSQIEEAKQLVKAKITSPKDAKYIVDEIESIVGKQGAIPVVQGPKTFSGPLKSMEAELKAKKVVYENNPILRWCFTNAKISIDRNDNWALVKTSVPTKRIDGVASLMDAFIVYENHKEEYLNMI